MRKLQHKLTVIVFLSMAFVFLAVFLSIYFSLRLYYQYVADGMTQVIRLNNGIIPNFQEYQNDNEDVFPDQIRLNEESEFQTRYFIVYLDNKRQPVDVDTEHIAAVQKADAFTMAEEALGRRRATGYIDRFRYRIVVNDAIDMVIFLDCRDSFSIQRVVLTILFLTEILITILVTLLYMVFSKHVVKPFEENALRQKQFITDASHELKTPLSIISANAEVLQYKNGADDDWTKNIITQADRMGRLINDLLALSKMDEVENDFTKESINFSALAAETLHLFQEVLDQKHVSLKTSLAENITLNGNAEQLKQLVSILADNAAKYVNPDGMIKITLKSSGKYAVLKIFNTAELEDRIDCERLFDRFYRLDSSHSSTTGGSGIGLSIASKIAGQHGGSLLANQTKNGICFTASISRKL